MRYSGDGEGLHRHVDPADGQTYLYAMSFLDAAPRWYACFDQPDLKAGYDIEVHCPADWTVLGNSPAERIGDGHWRLATTKPLASYFVTLVAGPYCSLTAEHDGIPLGLHARASLADHLAAEAEDLFTITRASFDAFHQLFGIRYPWNEYHQVFVPDFNAGAMENPGCVTLRDQYVFRAAATAGERVNRATTIAHEMAHQWFGDLVTMRWWDDLWLNESFAEYLGYRVCAGMPRLSRRAGLDPVRHHPQGLGQRGRPGAVQPSGGRQRLTGRGRGAGRLRRHLLRQGCRRAASAGRPPRRPGVSRRPAQALRPAQLRQCQPGRSAAGLDRGRRHRSGRLGATVAAHLGAGHARGHADRGRRGDAPARSGRRPPTAQGPVGRLRRRRRTGARRAGAAAGRRADAAGAGRAAPGGRRRPGRHLGQDPLR